METSSVIRYLLLDKESLGQYRSNFKVSFHDLKRRMFGIERGKATHLPDHHHRLLVSQSFEGFNSLSDVLTNGLAELTNGLLEMDGEEILVNPKNFHAWQELISGMPPLLLQCAYLWQGAKVDWDNVTEVQFFFEKILKRNFQYTALPSPGKGELANFCLGIGGFDDLHMHLNGATEVDVLWQDYIAFPDKIYNELAIGWKDEKVRELFEQESFLLSPLKFRNLLIIARRLRIILFKLTSKATQSIGAGSIRAHLARVNDEYSTSFGESYRNPFSLKFGIEDSIENTLPNEALMYIRVMDHISKNPEDGTSVFFHYYLLILGFCNRLLVQQTNQFGFEQFQKITLSGLREYTEKKYRNRFNQIRGNNLQHLSYLEGRFSPKASEKDLTIMLDLVKQGWQSMDTNTTLEPSAEPSLSLVAHFIKKSEGNRPHPKIRHRSLRIDIWNRARVLSLLIKKYGPYKGLVNGADAASSEFDAPPEVFAPIFRKLRPDIEHFTYHAGEDFHHILSGIRAIYEAIEFTDMHPGDRIGHAVAAGLSPSQWMKAVGKKLLIKRGEWLDNLLFVYHLSTLDDCPELKPMQPRLIKKIQQEAFKVYRKEYKLQDLLTAWQFRKYEPMLIFAKDREQASYLDNFDEVQWREVRSLVINSEVMEIMERYHLLEYRQYYEHIVEISSNSLIGVKWINMCQRALLRIMFKKNIIIEALPTSNIRIGHHHNFETYHLWNWLKWHYEDKNIPPIVLGTDDTGIFATNIFNEYASLFYHLDNRASRKHSALGTIKMFDENSATWRFGNP